MKTAQTICGRGFTLLRREAMWLATGMVAHRSKGTSSVTEAALKYRMAEQDEVLGFPLRSDSFGGFRKGFTLVEMMIAAGLFGLVVAGSIGVFIMCQKTWHTTSLRMDTACMASMAIERMVYGLSTNSGLRCAYSIVADTNKHKDSVSLNYWDTAANSPPAATHSANSLCAYAPYPGDGSWRIVYSNALDGVKYIDYIKKQRSIVLWQMPDQSDSRLSICNYVSDARIATNTGGISIDLTVWKKDGMFVASNQVSTYVKKRNK